MKERILNKVQKLLALSKSANEYEAAEALKRAQRMMKEHKISMTDIELSEMGRVKAEKTVAKTPKQFVVDLAHTIAAAFGVRPILNTVNDSAKIEFLGNISQAQVASYSFDVVYTHLNTARRVFLKKLHKNCKPATRARRVDFFSKGFVEEIANNLPTFELDEEETSMLERYFDEQMHDSRQAKTRHSKVVNEKDWDAYCNGSEKGREVNIHRPVTGSAETYYLE